MHICIILGNTHSNEKLGLNVGGIANQLLLLLPSYEKINDLRISLITKYTKYIPISNRMRIYQIHKFNNFVLDTIYFILKYPLKILKIHKKDSIDIINIHHYTYVYLFVILIKLIFKIPILMKIPFDFSSALKDTLMPNENKLRTRALNIFWFKIFKKIIRKIDFIRAINGTIYDDLIKLGYPKNNILLVPNGINTKYFI
jgi:glycosyltransferase involved in cell wall biosynthesis